MVCLQGEETQEEKHKNQYLLLYTTKRTSDLCVQGQESRAPKSLSLISDIPEPLQGKCKEQRINHVCSFLAAYSEHKPAGPHPILPPCLSCLQLLYF